MPPRVLSFRARYICQRCLQQRRNFAEVTSPPPPPPPPKGAARLTSRRLISIHGADAAQFLHGITTATVRPGQTACFYSGFLNAQGRVLHDVFIYPTAYSSEYATKILGADKPDPDTPAYFIEVDADEVGHLLSHLKKYKLRAKVKLRAIEPDEWSVWSVWDESEPWTPHPSPAPGTTAASTSLPTSANAAPTPSSSSSTPPTDSTIGGTDARAPGMGKRLVLPGTSLSLSSLPSTPDASSPSSTPPPAETSLAAYTVRRMLRGVPEGQHEIQREHALPQESNMDYMGGIDFRKGCYVGQELTIRTHHTGIVRKRILPVALYGEAMAAVSGEGNEVPELLGYDPGARVVEEFRPPAWSNIAPVGKKGRGAGKWIGGVANVGLSLCRVEMMTDMVLTGEGSRWSAEDEFKIRVDEGEMDARPELKVKAFVPDWIRSRTKVKAPNKQV